MIAFPLLIIPVAIYNVIAFITPGVEWNAKIYTFQMMSGVEWTVTFGDALIIFSLFLLFLEVVKSTRSSSKSIVDHLLSTLVFIGVLVEFLMVKQAATSTFVLLMAICFVDAIGGYSVSIRMARRDYTVEKVE